LLLQCLHRLLLLLLLLLLMLLLLLLLLLLMLELLELLQITGAYGLSQKGQDTRVWGNLARCTDRGGGAENLQVLEGLQALCCLFLVLIVHQIASRCHLIQVFVARDRTSCCCRKEKKSATAGGRGGKGQEQGGK
jgi:hypothetical protein